MTDERKQQIAGVFGRSAGEYDTVIPFFGTFAEALVDALDPRTGERALDVACGRGACLLRIARRVGPSGSAVGIDLAAEMVEQTVTDARGQGLGNVEAQVMDAEHLDLEDGSFDLAACGFGVFFFPDPTRALAEVRRVLRAGGRFGATTFVGANAGFPSAADVAVAVLGESAQAAARVPPSPVATADGLAAVLREVGFADIERTQVSPRFVFPDVDAYIAWLWSHGGRRILEQLTSEQLERYRELSAEKLEASRAPDGFELVQGVDITVAR